MISLILILNINAFWYVVEQFNEEISNNNTPRAQFTQIRSHLG